MKATNIAKYTLITYAFISSPIIGIGFLGYLLYTDRKLKETEVQLKSALSEDNEQNILTDNLENVKIKGKISLSSLYEGCVVENYQDKFYRIVKPSGEYVPKIFLSQKEAEKEINFVKPFLKETPNNINFVK